MVKRDDPLLFSVGASDEPGREVQVLHVQCDQFADPDPGGVQQLQHGVIPEAFRVHTFRLFQKQLYLFGSENFRVFSLRLGSDNPLRGADFYLSDGDHVAVKGFDGSQKSGNGRGGFAPPLHPDHIISNHTAIRFPETFAIMIM